MLLTMRIFTQSDQMALRPIIALHTMVILFSTPQILQTFFLVLLICRLKFKGLEGGVDLVTNWGIMSI